MTRFFRFVLRTTDVDAARTFYAAVLAGEEANIVQLHEQAIARGARPHWLGFLDVGAVDAAAAAFVERGASPLGPKWVNPEGLEAAVVRDPGGALLALAKPPPQAPGAASAVVAAWHLLRTADVERATANYGELFGWEFKEPIDLGSLGLFHPFAWQRGGSPVGWMSDIATRPGVHAHWLFHFRVPVLEPALDAVRAGAGVVVASYALATGERIAVCDDPQGAAFALLEGPETPGRDVSLKATR
jgi:predicted enzyme related to lactoylglutathione lyase